jgi:hypothetical protein
MKVVEELDSAHIDHRINDLNATGRQPCLPPDFAKDRLKIQDIPADLEAARNICVYLRSSVAKIPCFLDRGRRPSNSPSDKTPTLGRRHREPKIATYFQIRPTHPSNSDH